MASKKIIVTGSNGQLGCELRELASSFAQYDFIFYSRDQFPINDPSVAEKIFAEHQPAYFINCAAYTAVDKAESEQELARDSNGTAVGKLALLSRNYDTKFIHVSTDYVFNGEQSQPLKEDDAVDPVNAYGATKLLGEQLAMEHNPDSVIIRTAWVYSSFGKNFVKTMIRLMKEKENISVVSDQYGSPTYAADLAEAIMNIIDGGRWVPGIYHYSNEGVISWFDFAAAIRDMIASACVVHPITTDQYPTPAKRPKYSVLDKTKIRETYKIEIKDWQQSLAQCMAKITAKD